MTDLAHAIFDKARETMIGQAFAFRASQGDVVRAALWAGNNLAIVSLRALMDTARDLTVEETARLRDAIAAHEALLARGLVAVESAMAPRVTPT